MAFPEIGNRSASRVAEDLVDKLLVLGDALAVAVVDGYTADVWILHIQ